MNLKKRIINIEQRLKSQVAGNGVVTITGMNELEFEEKKMKYLKYYPEPTLFVFVKKFTRPDCLARASWERMIENSIQ